jgi:hypothetical protein
MPLLPPPSPSVMVAKELQEQLLAQEEELM